MTFHQYCELVGLALIATAALTLIGLPIYGAYVCRKRMQR